MRGGNDGECRPCDDYKNHPVMWQTDKMAQKDDTDALYITKEQKEIVALQWFYNSMMDLYTYYKGRQK